MKYSCPHCPKKYKSKRDLRRHVQDKHDEVVGNESEKDNKQTNVVSNSKTSKSQQGQKDKQKRKRQQQEEHIDNITKKSKESVFTLKHPFTMTIAGPTSCGKTSWIKTLLQHAEKYIEPRPNKILWFYKRWQPLYTEMQETIPYVEFIQGIPKSIHEDSFFDTRSPTIFIFDDLMKDTANNNDIANLWTEGSHHRNLSVVNLMQNLYEKGTSSRTMNLNNQYMVLFKNPRDKQQISMLARQMYPRHTDYFMDRFTEATKKPYGYLFIDLKQDTDEADRLKSDVLEITTDQPKCNPTYPWCPQCGSVYATMYDIKHHLENGCMNDISHMENGCETFERWFEEAKTENDRKWYESIKKYKKDGMTQKEAEDKAESELNDQQLFIDKYKTLLLNLIPLEESRLHHSIVNAIERELSQGQPLKKAIKVGMQTYDDQFQKLFDEKQEK